VFGPVVNLAARAVKLAAPGRLVVPEAVAAAAGLRGEALGAEPLKGFETPVRLVSVPAD
jgi:class 3 adenylate cyclase